MLPTGSAGGRVQSARDFGVALLDSVAPLTTPESVSPDSKQTANSRESMAVWALAMSAFVLNLNSNVMGALLPFIKSEFAFADDGAFWLLAAAGIGSAVGAFFVPDVSRRFGRRSVLVASLSLFVVASLLHMVVTAYWPLLGLRVLAGLATGLAYATASAAAAEIAPYERRGAVMGRFNAVMFLAIPLGLPLAVLLATTGYWSITFAVQAAVGAIAIVLSLRCVPALPASPGGRRWPLLKNPAVVAVLLSTMLHVGSFFTVVQMATSWLDESGMVPKEDQVWVWVGLGALSVVGSALFGKFSDKVGKRQFVLATSAILVLCFAVLSRGPSPMVLLLVGCVLALAAAARTGPLQALVSGLVPADQLGALMGLRGFSMQVGIFLFAMGAAGLTQRLGFEGVFILAAGCQFFSYLAIRFGVREPSKLA
ncbi:MAG: DHA1 family inner membrane transport protein [Planctomycetota bacterium]|jgi:DHA1 family inner membrane transport protein